MKLQLPKYIKNFIIAIAKKGYKCKKCDMEECIFFQWAQKNKQEIKFKFNNNLDITCSEFIKKLHKILIIDEILKDDAS